MSLRLVPASFVSSLRRNHKGRWLPCDEIIRNGGSLATKSQGKVASLRRNRGGGWWYPCDEIARGVSFLAAKLQGTVASLREIAGAVVSSLRRNRKGR